jgi:hypothetical protein
MELDTAAAMAAGAWRPNGRPDNLFILLIPFHPTLLSKGELLTRLNQPVSKQQPPKQKKILQDIFQHPELRLSITLQRFQKKEGLS